MMQGPLREDRGGARQNRGSTPERSVLVSGMKKVRGGNNSSDKLWRRNRDPANPMGDDFRRKAVRIFERLPAPSDAQDATEQQIALAGTDDEVLAFSFWDL